jgi:hypothetical protein
VESAGEKRRWSVPRANAFPIPFIVVDRPLSVCVCVEAEGKPSPAGEARLPATTNSSPTRQTQGRAGPGTETTDRAALFPQAIARRLATRPAPPHSAHLAALLFAATPRQSTSYTYPYTSRSVGPHERQLFRGDNATHRLFILFKPLLVPSTTANLLLLVSLARSRTLHHRRWNGM